MKPPFKYKLSLLSALALTSFSMGCTGTQTLNLDFTYLPEQTYTTRMESKVIMVMEIEGDDQIREQITQGELSLPVTSEIQTEQVFRVITGNIGPGGRIHFSGELVKSNRTMKINGTPQSLEGAGEQSPSGFKYTGLIREDGTFDLEALKMESTHPQAEQIMLMVINAIKKQFEFPRESLQTGDIFSKEMDFKFPRVPPVKIKTNYQLDKIDRRRGYFSITQTFVWTGVGDDGVDIEMNGNGTGSGIYDKKMKMWERLEFDLDLYFLIDMRVARIETKGNTRSTMVVTVTKN